MILENTKKFIKYYGKGKKIKLVGFFMLSLIAGFLELLGVALIYPFIIIITNPSIAQSNKFYLLAQNYLPFLNGTIFALMLGLAILGLFIFKNLFMVMILSLQTKFTTYWKRDITALFMKYYTYASYKDIIKISPSDKTFCMYNISANVIDGFVVRGITLLINSIIILMIIGFLIFKFPLAAIVTSCFVIISLSVQNKFFKKKTTDIAAKISKTQADYNKILLESITNIKELKILSAENIFYKNYMNKENKFRNVQVAQTFYSSIPPYIVEIFVVLSILILGMIISAQNITNNTALIASFAVVAAALFRIAPALNRIQSSIININTFRNFIKHANNQFETLKLDNVKIHDDINIPKLDFKTCIELKNIDFSYEKEKTIKNINLRIEKGDFLGIVGLSGAGKSTLADIIMGLLPVDNGKILVDDIELNEKNFIAFRQKIGYVAQEINVMDASFKDNITWGIESSDVDENKVIEVLKEAQLYDFVQTFDEGINAIPFIGANGLSQGQKQRLAIARALYRDPEIILLDEATSSLDVVCENEITEVLSKVGQNKTIIAIAHRLSTLKSCNKLVYLKDGRIVDIGTFEELSKNYPDFDKLVKLSAITTKN